MITGKTDSGFEFEISEKALDNMELVDALADAQDDDPLAVSKVCTLFLGKDLKKKLYAFLRTEDGRVPVERVTKTIMEIFTFFGKEGKN